MTRRVPDDVVSRSALIAVLAFLAAAWIFSGGCGMLARPLAGGLVWCCLAVIVAALHPKREAGFRPWAVFGAGLAVAVLATASMNEVVRLAGLAIFAAVLSTLDRNHLDQRILRVAARALAVFVLYRFALTSIPLVWHVSEAIGSALGQVASVFWGHPVSVGATFAGLDHLVLMTALVAGWALELERPRVRAVLLTGSAIAIGQAVYLLFLSLAVDLASVLPPAPPAPPPEPYVPPDWAWGDAARTLLPWNLPVLAVVWHLGVASAMLGLAKYRAETPAAEGKQDAGTFDWRPWAPVAVAAMLPLVCVLSLGKSDLSDKTVLAYDRGYLDWDVPVHDRYGADSSGRFGMLPVFVESLGGRFQRSSDLSQEDLSGADVLILIHPNQAWPDEVLLRVQEYVRRGGSLLVAAGPRLQDSNSASSYNEVLEPLGMPVRFDTAVSQNEAWRHGMLRAAHPAAIGLGDERDRFGMTAAASVQLPWRASPILVGRWGWSDPGSDFFLTGRARWEPRERLGDLVLAAERRVGSGRVIVLGDNGCLTNQGNVRAYRFTGRLLAYLARHGGSPQAWWRQLIAIVLAGAMVVLLARVERGEVLAALVVALLLATWLSTEWSCRSWEVLPDGRGRTPNNLAYLDASHLEAYAETPWNANGIDGLALTLMRNGFLVLAADDLSSEQLSRASVVVSIAPVRQFTLLERRRIKRFVEDGGALIAMAGAPEGRKTNQVMNQFGLGVPLVYHRPGSGRGDAVPLGCVYRPYPDDQSSLAPVLFHSAWPLSGVEREYRPQSVVSAEVPGRVVPAPVVARSDAGKGVAVLIGDTGFAMNKTLENQDGGSLADDHLNAQFWRWLIGQLPGREPWQPPPFDWGRWGAKPGTAQADGEEVQP
ncbi:MAG: hypothetical protein GXX96_36835 [Planctomycetaceae bacterium]|nr:hypothetical protein [Planctomycetaceae bacterium]